MSRARAVQRCLAFIGIHWSPEPKAPRPPRRGLHLPRPGLPRLPLPPMLRRGLGFVGVWLEAPDGRVRRSL